MTQKFIYKSIVIIFTLVLTVSWGTKMASATIYVFSSCGKSGEAGPSQAQCDSEYYSTYLQGQVTVTSGYQYWTVPAGVTSITVNARGAQGASVNSGVGGKGSQMIGTFAVTPGQTIIILVGQQPTSAGNYAAGGGGTFVATGTVYTTAVPLIVAGGGGGGYSSGGIGMDALTGTTGGGPNPGTNGYGAPSVSCGGGGGGFYSSGGADTLYSAGGGQGFRQGGAGGTFSGYQPGGFGGGAPADYVGSCNMQGGAGGGYSGASGLTSGGYQIYGYGGGSYNNGTNQTNVGAVQSGNGAVTITAIPANTAPVLSATPSIASITATGATLGATITSDGGATITARGTCWSTTTTPANCTAEGGTSVSSFTQARTGMSNGTTYNYWGYATNSVGTAYTSSYGTFTTLTVPTVTAISPSTWSNTSNVSITSITGTQFVSGATVKLTKSGQSDISCTGFSFASSTQLSGGTCPMTGAAFGSWNVVVTNPDAQVATLSDGFVVNNPPTISSSPTISSITSTGATFGATITSDGGATITARGTCWSTTTIPANCTPEGGTSVSSFTQARTGMSNGTIYNYWGYVSNAYDTIYTSSYGTFTTLTVPTVTALSPSSSLNNSSITITSVSGTQFVSGATVKLTKSGQSNIVCTGFSFTSSTQLSGGSCPVTDAAVGTWNVVVTNPDAQVATLTNGFTVNQAPPAVLALSPASALNNSTITITSVIGTQFVSGATVKLTKSGQSNIVCTGFSFTSSTQLSGGSCPITDVVAGDWNVVVTNPDAQTGSLTNGFNVMSSPPTGGSITPSSGSNNSSISITSIIGSQFVSGATVKLTKSGQSDITCTGFSFTSSTQLSSGSCPITGLQLGNWNVLITNPDGQTGLITNGFAVTYTAAPVSTSSQKSGTNATLPKNIIASPKNVMTNGLIGYWTFDGKDVVNGVALDRSGNNNKGNLMNIATTTFYTAGKLGQGFNFDGVNDYVRVPLTAAFSSLNAQPYTISLWVNDTRSVAALHSTFDRLISWDVAGGATNIQLGVGDHNSDYQVYYIQEGNSTTIKNATGAAPYGWNHVVATSDGTNFKMYINGTKNDGGTISSGSSAYTGDTNYLYIGQRGNGAYSLTKLDDVRIYNRTLSASEVTQLYNSGKTTIKKF